MFSESMTKKVIGVLFCAGLVTTGIMCFADGSSEKKDEPAPEMAPASAQKKKPTREELASQDFIKKLSLTYGTLIQKNMNNPIVKLDVASVIQGIKDGQEGKSAPLSDAEYEEAIGLIQQYAFEDMSKNNLKDAEAFLEKNAKEAGVISLENGKVQYKITQPGTGETVTADTVPTINFTATYSNGTKLGSSEQQGGPIAVPLNDTLPGFSKGIMGMKAGEKRTIYVHPELAYGASGPLPNGLLIFDIEVTKVDPKPIADNDDDDSDDGDDIDFLADNDDDEDDDDDDEDPAG